MTTVPMINAVTREASWCKTLRWQFYLGFGAWDVSPGQIALCSSWSERWQVRMQCSQRWYGHFPRTHLWNHLHSLEGEKCDGGLFLGLASRKNGAVSAQVQSPPTLQIPSVVPAVKLPCSQTCSETEKWVQVHLHPLFCCLNGLAGGLWALVGETLMVLDQFCRLGSFFVLWFLHLYNGCHQLPRPQFAMAERTVSYKIMRVILKTLVSSMQSNKYPQNSRIP